MKLYRICVDNNVNKGYFTYKWCSETKNAIGQTAGAICDQISSGKYSSTPESNHRPPMEDKDLAKFFDSLRYEGAGLSERKFKINWRCAFTSYDQLRSVFTNKSFLNRLMDHNVQLAILNVERPDRNVKKAEKQCMYYTPAVKSVEYHPLSIIP